MFKNMSNISGIYIITDALLRPQRTHAQIAAAACKGGATIVQLRDKKASDSQFYNWAVEIREITRAHNVLFVINDRVDIATAVGADGINIGQTDMPVSAARKVLPKSAFIGVSCSNMQETMRAQADGADYIGFGPVYCTTTKEDAAEETGLDTLRKVVESVSIPVVAIGGINHSNAADVAATGVQSISVVSAVVCADDMVEATASLVKAFNRN